MFCTFIYVYLATAAQTLNQLSLSSRCSQNR